MGKAIIIASGKGGTGKTTATAALSSALAARGRSVLCLDADAGLKNLDLCLGLADRAVFDFGDVICRRCSLSQAVVPHPDIPWLYFLTAPVEPISEADGAGFSALIRFLKGVFDYCLIDSPAGLGTGFSSAAAAADGAVIISAADPSSCRDSGRIVMELGSMGVLDIRLIVNRVRRGVLFKTKTTIDDAVDAIGARLIGLVPEDERVILAGASQRPLALCRPGPAMSAFERIARRLDGERVPLEL